MFGGSGKPKNNSLSTTAQSPSLYTVLLLVLHTDGILLFQGYTRKFSITSIFRQSPKSPHTIVDTQTVIVGFVIAG